MSRYCPKEQNYITDCAECSDRLCEAFFCLVVGSRTFDDYPLLCSKLDQLLEKQDKVVIVSGGAKGADSLAERYAEDRSYPLIIFPAEWDKLGNRAGYIRNRTMHDFLSRFEKRGCVAFWDGKSKGTQHNFKLAEEYGIPIRVIKGDKNDI